MPACSSAYSRSRCTLLVSSTGFRSSVDRLARRRGRPAVARRVARIPADAVAQQVARLARRAVALAGRSGEAQNTRRTGNSVRDTSSSERGGKICSAQSTPSFTGSIDRVADDQVEHDLRVARLELLQHAAPGGRARSRAAHARAGARPARPATSRIWSTTSLVRPTSSVQSRRKAWPSSDRRTPRVLRWNSGAPTKSSSCWMRAVTTERDTRICRAASREALRLGHAHEGVDGEEAVHVRTKCRRGSRQVRATGSAEVGIEMRRARDGWGSVAVASVCPTCLSPTPVDHNVSASPPTIPEGGISPFRF